MEIAELLRAALDDGPDTKLDVGTIAREGRRRVRRRRTTEIVSAAVVAAAFGGLALGTVRAVSDNPATRLRQAAPVTSPTGRATGLTPIVTAATMTSTIEQYGHLSLAGVTTREPAPADRSGDRQWSLSASVTAVHGRRVAPRTIDVRVFLMSTTRTCSNLLAETGNRSQPGMTCSARVQADGVTLYTATGPGYQAGRVREQVELVRPDGSGADFVVREADWLDTFLRSSPAPARPALSMDTLVDLTRRLATLRVGR